MKTIRLDPGGLLWRLATFYGPLHEWVVLREGSDICTYTRAVLKGLFICLIIIFAGSLGGWVVVDSVMFWAFRLLTHGVMDMSTTALIGTTVAFVLVVFLAGAAILNITKRLVVRYRAKRPQVAEDKPSAAGQMYRAWKDKTCFKIDFKG